MATPSGAPAGAAAPNASYQLPDCIIASSNRFNDLLPFCNSIYHAEPQKWGCILPWEFPQGGVKDVEEDFLRKYFDETEIHMQGGAHGFGAGFRFLKQAWYSIALWNYEQRIPAITTWWLESKENSSVLEDPTMREALCNDEATPETCFDSRDIQTYGRSLLACVVKVIQGRVKAKQAPQVEQAQTTDKPRSTSDSNVNLGLVKTKSHPTGPCSDVNTDRKMGKFTYSRPPRATSAIVFTHEVATPFPMYEEKSQGKQQARNSEHAYSAWNAGYPNQQVQGRERGGRLSSAGGSTRGASYDRPAQEYQHRFGSNMFPPNGALVDGPASVGAPLPGSALHPNAIGTYSNMPPHMPGVLPVPAHGVAGSRAPHQHTRGPNFQSGEYQALSSVTPSSFVGGSANRGHLAHRHDMERLPNDMSTNQGFNNISTRSGDVRRSSFSSRGTAGIRGANQFRGGKRGGRGRDSGHQAPVVFEEGMYARKGAYESYSKPSSNYGKRRGSAYHENTWRSGSEHPQIENTLPQRVLSGPSEYPVYQGFPNVAGSHLLPAFTFPHSQSGERPNQGEHRPSPIGLARLEHAVPDFEVDARYIGSDATHVNELVVFNIPVHLSEKEVAMDFSRTCDVEVISVHFDIRNLHVPDDAVKLAFIELPNHNIARRVLDLREVYLYGKPLSVKVPRKMLNHSSMPFNPSQPSHDLHASGSSFVPSSQLPLDSYGYSHEPIPTAPFNPSVMASNNHGHLSGAPRPDLVNFQPATPFNIGRGDSALTTVLSSNATPVTSEPNTPRKKKNKKKKTATPHAKLIEDNPGASADSANRMTSQHTTSRTKYQKQGLQEVAGSNNLVTADEATSSNKASATNDTKAQAGQTRNQSPAPPDPPVDSSQVTPESGPSSESSRSGEQKSDATPTVSPRSQLPKDLPSQADLAPDNKQSQVPVIDKEPEMRRVSSTVSDKDRPDIVGRISDSDHVDESFHTASASPPTDKQSRARVPSTTYETSSSATHTRNSATLSKKHSTSSPLKDNLKDTDANASRADTDDTARHDSTSASPVPGMKVDSASSKGASSTPLPISVVAPTPPREQPASVSSNTKPHLSPSQRSVSDPSRVEQAASSIDASHAQDSTSDRARDLTLDKKSLLVEVEKAGENTQNLTAQPAVSTSSVPPTPMTTYHTAPTTPASLPVSKSNDSAEKSLNQPKTPAKKGPSQTESFSMFGKKQQKQKKPAKSKGTLKGKPLEPNDAPNRTSPAASQDMSGAVIQPPGGAPKSGKKRALTVKTEIDSHAPAVSTNSSKIASKSGENAGSEVTPTATSGQESPSKGGIRNFFGLFGRAKSPSATGKETSLEDALSQNQQINSKAPTAIPQAVFNIDHLLQQRTFDDERTHGDRSVSNTSIDTDFIDANDHDTSGMSVTGLGILASHDDDVKETPKKRRKKKKNKSAKKSENQTESSLGDADETFSITTPSAETMATPDPYDVDSDSNSDKSSTTMGRPTPPVSPITLTPSKRRLFEQRLTEEHIVSPKAPRNKHIKKKSYSRVASSATATAVQGTPPTTTAMASEIELEQQKRILEVYKQLTGGDEDGDTPGTVTTPQPSFRFNVRDDEGHTHVHEYQYGKDGDDIDDEAAALGIEEMKTADDDSKGS